MEYKHIIVETSENVGIITLNRGSVLNAVNEGMLSETAHQLGVFDSDTSIGAVVLKVIPHIYSGHFMAHRVLHILGIQHIDKVLVR